METEALVKSLRASFASVPDPRSRLGRRHSLAAVFTLSTAAMLSGVRSLYAIFLWGRLQSPRVTRALSFRHKKTPSVPTLHRLCSRLDVAAFEQALHDWVEENLDEGKEAIAIDGKGLRAFTEKTYLACALLSLIHPAPAQCWLKRMVSSVLGEAELTVATEVVSYLPLEGKVLTGDALYTQMDLCQQVLNSGGDYLFTMKGNQEELREDITMLLTIRFGKSSLLMPGREDGPVTDMK